MGVGEVLVTSVDFEGTGQGFDYELISKVSSICSVPFIVSGRIRKINFYKKLLKLSHIDTLAAAKVLHYKNIKPQARSRAKNKMKKNLQ